MNQNLVTKIIANPSYVIGDDVRISVDFTNCGDATVYLHKPLTISGVLRYDLLLIKKDNVEVPYHGKYFHSTYVNDRLVLEPTMNFKFNIDLAKEYLLDDSGTYNIEIRKDALISGSLESLNYSNYNLDFEMSVQEDVPVMTHVQVAQKVAKSSIKCKSFGNDHCVYNSKDIKEVNTTKEAHDTSERALSCINGVAPLPKSFTPYYELMFCKNNHDSWNDLVGKYGLMLEYLDNGMKYWLRAKDCDPLDFGYIFPADMKKNVYFCPMYDKAPTMPDKTQEYDSKAGVIIHEVSHKAAETKDHFYSYSECKLKALECDNLTVTNADCVQMFAELVLVHNAPMQHDEL